MSRKSVQWEPSCSKRIDRRADGQLDRRIDILRDEWIDTTKLIIAFFSILRKFLKIINTCS